jgi:hypothetical protein
VTALLIELASRVTRRDIVNLLLLGRYSANGNLSPVFRMVVVTSDLDEPLSHLIGS